MPPLSWYLHLLGGNRLQTTARETLDPYHLRVLPGPRAVKAPARSPRGRMSRFLQRSAPTYLHPAEFTLVPCSMESVGGPFGPGTPPRRRPVA